MERVVPYEWIAHVAVDAPDDTSHAMVTASTVGADGVLRVFGSWPVPARGDAEVVLRRSPDRSSVAVVVHETLVVAGPGLAPTDAVHVRLPGGREPEPGRAAPPWIAWPDEAPAPTVVFPGARAPLTALLEDGWTLDVDGSVAIDGGHSGDGGGRTFLVRWHGESDETLAAALAELRAGEARAARLPVPFTCVATRGSTWTVVHQESPTPLRGRAVLHWPPVVSTHGLLLRRSTETVVLPPSEHAGTTTEMQEPWLVTRDGRISTVPVHLGVSPLCELPGGRLLLPGSDALWLDGLDEPLHTLGPGGDLAPLLHGGGPVHATGLLGQVAPDLLPTEPPEHRDESPWGVAAARVDRDGDELVLLLTETGWDVDVGTSGPPSAAVVGLSLSGSGGPRLLARAERRPGRHVAIAL